MTTKQAQRTKADIEAEIAAARERLADNVSTLIGEVHPKAIVDRTVEDAKSFAATTFAQAKEQVLDDKGQWRTDRLMWAGAATAGAVTFGLIVRSIVKGFKRR